MRNEERSDQLLRLGYLTTPIETVTSVKVERGLYKQGLPSPE